MPSKSSVQGEACSQSQRLWLHKQSQKQKYQGIPDMPHVLDIYIYIFDFNILVYI